MDFGDAAIQLSELYQSVDDCDSSLSDSSPTTSSALSVPSQQSDDDLRDHNNMCQISGAVPIVYAASRERKLCTGSMDRNLNAVDVTADDEPLVFPKVIAWDWPLTNDGVARGIFTEEKFTIHLPLNSRSKRISSGTTRQFSRVSECNFYWTIGLSSFEGGSVFWRMELEIIRNLNMLVLTVSRDISRVDKACKKLKLVRKVYSLPTHYDVSTVSTVSEDRDILIEVLKREQNRVGIRRIRPQIKRHNTDFQ